MHESIYQEKSDSCDNYNCNRGVFLCFADSSTKNNFAGFDVDSCF